MARSCIRQSLACLGLLIFMTISPISHASEDQSFKNKECVILLHGLGRTKLSLRKLQARLKDRYHVINNSYPSRKHSIEELAKISIQPALEECQGVDRIHFVTHSLGGILVR